MSIKKRVDRIEKLSRKIHLSVAYPLTPDTKGLVVIAATGKPVAEFDTLRQTESYLRQVQRFGLAACLAMIFFCGLQAQTVTPTPDRSTPITVTQGFVDDATKAFALVVTLRDALQKAQMASGADTVTKAALQAQIDSLNGLMVIYERKDAVYESLLVLRDKAFAAYDVIVKIQSDMIDKLSKQLAKGKTKWDKFLTVLKEVAAITLGIAIGHAGL